MQKDPTGKTISTVGGSKGVKGSRKKKGLGHIYCRRGGGL